MLLCTKTQSKREVNVLSLNLSTIKHCYFLHLAVSKKLLVLPKLKDCRAYCCPPVHLSYFLNTEKRSSIISSCMERNSTLYL